ncbi:MAG: cellulase family glycosylhydrolase [Chloroflexi bacterium]|nr:cellulase family glycosylhydrolase [Chloroflexota bacterium]
MMRVDEAKLRAYLDGELSQSERDEVERYLVNSLGAQATLAQMHQMREQVKQGLSLLAPIAKTASSALAALKRVQAQLEPASDMTLSANSRPTKIASLSVWESPSLLAEFKISFKKFRSNWRESMTKGLIWATVVTLVTMSSAVALMVWPDMGRQLAEQVQQIAPPDVVKLPITEEQGISMTTVVVALQPISRGSEFITGSIGRRGWPTRNLPTGFIADEAEAIGKVARTDIVQGQVIVRGMLVDASGADTPDLSVSFGYGIQAAPNGDTAANINHIKQLGFEWVKFQMAWQDVEPVPHSYAWGLWDDVISTYAANDIKIMVSIPKAPDWARPAADDKSVEGPPADPAKYADFVAKVADRYRGKVQAIEIWNEQNLWYEAGGKGRINAADYVKLLQLAYQAIKAANPEMIVISGAMSPAGNVGDMATDDIDYLRQMYAHGVKGYFDALGANPSGYNCPALADWRTVTPEEAGADPEHGVFRNRHHSWCFLGTLEAYHQVMTDSGDFAKPIAITEFGWGVSDNPQPGYEYARDNTPAEQAQWIVEAYQWAKEQGWVGPMVLGNLDYNVTEPDNLPLAYFGILNTPAYEGLVKMPK